MHPHRMQRQDQHTPPHSLWPCAIKLEITNESQKLLVSLGSGILVSVSSGQSLVQVLKKRKTGGGGGEGDSIKIAHHGETFRISFLFM